MSNLDTTNVPAMTAAQRQANRRARIAEEVRLGREARHLQREFDACCAELGSSIDVWVEMIDPFSDCVTLADCVKALHGAVLAQRAHKLTGRPEPTPKARHGKRNVTHGQTKSKLRDSAVAVPKSRVTPAPSKGNAKPRRVRERVGK